MTGLFNIHTVFGSLSPKQSRQEERKEQFVSSLWSRFFPLSRRSQVVISSSPADGGVTFLISVFCKEVFWAGVGCHVRKQPTSLLFKLLSSTLE